MTAILLGVLVGIFILHPANEFVYYHEYEKFDPGATTAGRFVTGKLLESVTGGSPVKTFFYALFGGMLGFATAVIYANLHRKILDIRHLHDELGKDLDALIDRGEGPDVEFKSSLRWDLVENRVNRALEQVVMKTLAGFMNQHGGTLLIGVSDSGNILGLEKDYQSLKRQDRDGFEQALMTAVSNNLGADLCQNLYIVFHTLEDKDVCRIIVSPASRPVFTNQKNAPQLFVRTGGGTRELNVQEAMDFVAARWPKN